MSDKHMRTLTIGLFGRLAAAIVSLTMAATGAFAQGNSQVAHARHMKVSDDLASVLDHGNTNHVRWVQKGANGDLVRVIIAVDPTGDKTLKALRKAVLDAGGSVHRHLQSLDQVVAMLPASMVDAIAARNDVVKVAPNRSLAATASLTEKVVGASDVRSLGTSGTTLDGRGVGIAFLDSGIMSSHGAFAGSSGTSRVTARVDLVPPPTTSTFTSGVDSTLNLVTTGSTAPAKDPFGHGTLAASVAAGKGVYSLLTESGGIAPGATLVDVRVLDDKGVGDLGTALAGIDWILAHAKENNIRVLNISLGTDSTDSYLDDPFCKAVRAVVASGVTVVVAAGNYGLGTDGREHYGTISSPGDEPSAITVGSSNSKGTTDRSDDVVNNFSSRGLTRGAHVDASGLVHHDNLLKPDLVAPGAMPPDSVSSE